MDSPSEWDEALDSYSNSLSTSVLFIDTLRVIEYNTNHPKAPLTIMKERLLSFDVGLNRIQYPFLESIYKLIVEGLIENGVLMHMIEEWRDFKQLQPEQTEKEPEVLTLEQLAIGFKLFGICLIASSFTFVTEILILCFKKLNKLITFVVSLLLFFRNIRIN